MPSLLKGYYKEKYYKILNSDFEANGIDEDFKKQIDLQIAFCENMIDCIANNNPVSETFAEAHYYELMELRKASHTKTPMSTIFARVMKFMGFYISEKNTTLNEFRGILDLIKDHQRKEFIKNGKATN